MLLLCGCGRCKSFPSFSLKILSLAGSVIAAGSCVQTWALNHLACFCEKPGVLFLGTRTKLEQKDIKLRRSQGANCCHWNSFCQNHAGCRRLCCCHECDSPWPIPVQQFLEHVRMPWIPSDRFSCHVVLCTSICSLLVVRCTSHAEASKQLVLEHRCQPCQPCQIMPGDPVDLRNSHANKGRKLSAPNNRALFGLSKAQHLNTRSPQNVGSSGFP